VNVRRTVAALLLVVEPLTLALAVSAALEWLLSRGAGAVGFLLARLAITGVGMVAGMRLWDGRPGGLALARWSYAGQLAATILAHSTRLWPTTLAPGVAEPAFVCGLAWYAAWLAWTFVVGRNVA
jgi:hypothetical protein